MPRFLTISIVLGLCACVGTPEGESDCGTQGLATVNLGSALSHIRVARQFADSQEQRLALAELESKLVLQIRSEPDSGAQGAAWLFADSEAPLQLAATQQSQINGRAELAASAGMRSFDEERAILRAEVYRDYMNRAVSELDPRAPLECAADVWQSFYDAALRAAAF